MTNDANEQLRAELGITERAERRGPRDRIPIATSAEIFALRRALGLSQSQFANRLGLPNAFIVSRWENGKTVAGAGYSYSDQLCGMLAKARELGVLPSENGGQS